MNKQNLLGQQRKYIFGFLVFALVVVILYAVNPGQLMTEYIGTSVFFTLFVGMMLISMILIYQHFISTSSTSTSTFFPFASANAASSDMFPVPFLVQSVYLTLAFLLTGVLIYFALRVMGLFALSGSWIMTAINVLLFCIMMAITVRILFTSGLVPWILIQWGSCHHPLCRFIHHLFYYLPCLIIPYYQFFLNSMAYLPCAINDGWASLFASSSTSSSASSASSASFSSTSAEKKLLALSACLLSGYFFTLLWLKPFLRKQYLLQGGTQYLNDPIPTDIQTDLVTYMSLNGIRTDGDGDGSDGRKYQYRYAVAFWMYLDAFAPNQHGMQPILSYGHNPSVQYDSGNNTLYVTMTSPPSSSSSAHPRILYQQPGCPLQKWNHIALNCVGGTMDVFINGQLVRSNIDVVPYMSWDMLTIGSLRGVKGSVCNLIYFREPVTVEQVNHLYTPLKQQNPPVI